MADYATVQTHSVASAVCSEHRSERERDRTPANLTQADKEDGQIDWEHGTPVATSWNTV